MRCCLSCLLKNWYFEVGEVCLCGCLCWFVATMYLFSQALSIVLQCGGLLLKVIYSFSSTRCIWLPGFALIRVSCHCVIDVMLLHCACCTRLIQTSIIVCLFSELSSASVRVWHTWAVAAAHPLEFEVSRCKTSQFARCFLPVQTRVCHDLLYTVFDTGMLYGFEEAVDRWLLLSLSLFFSFLWHSCLWGCKVKFFTTTGIFTLQAPIFTMITEVLALC